MELDDKIIAENNTENQPESTTKRLSLAEMSGLVNAIVQSVFVENNGETEYMPEYFDVVSDYWKLYYFRPDLDIGEMSISDFYEKRLNEEFDYALEEISLLPAVWEINKAVEKKIDYLLSKKPLEKELTEILRSINAIVGKFADDVSRENYKQMIGDFKNFVGKADSESITESVLKKHREDLAKEKKPVLSSRAARNKKGNNDVKH